MARIRTIKPEFFTSEDIVRLSPFARLLYQATWCEADREGRLAWKPLTLKMRYFPADNLDIDVLCAELIEAGLVKAYGAGLAFNSELHRAPACEPTRGGVQAYRPPKSMTRGARVPDASGKDCDTSARASDAQVGKEGKGKDITVVEANASPTPRSQENPQPDPAIQSVTPSLGEASPEAVFWSKAPDLAKAGIGRSMLGKLANLLAGDFENGIHILQDAAKAKDPRPYLGKIIRDLETKAATPPPSADPPWVQDARSQGYEVERVGNNWRFGGDLYDDNRDMVWN